MIVGLGVDICAECRFLHKLTNHGFLARVFHPSELLFLENFSNPVQKSAYLAGVWAAKESFVKGLGVGIFQLPLNELLLAKRPSGAPYWLPKEKVEAYVHARGILHTHVSLSHGAGMAVAVTIFESE